MRRHHKRGTARFGCLRRFCLSTHSESFGVIRWPECDCVCAGVGLSGGRGRLLTHVHRASACTLNAVGLLPVSGCGDARVAPPCPTTLCVWRNLPYLTLPVRPQRQRPHTRRDAATRQPATSTCAPGPPGRQSSDLYSSKSKQIARFGFRHTLHGESSSTLRG